MQAPDRSIFLHPPRPARETQINQATRETLTRAGTLLREAFPPNMSTKTQSELLLKETTASAAIESEYRTPYILAHHRALLHFMKEPLTNDYLLKLHSKMMRDQPHAQPGRYRSVGVTVGRYRPPDPALVPSLMEELINYTSERGHHSIIQAAWAHIEFETVHPFADGNGRTGRALINRILESPIPISEYILRNRQEYYALLDSGNWEEYLDWFSKGIIEQTTNIQPDQPK